MKKFLSILLAATIFVTTFVPALADESDTVSNLILEMKAKFNISDEEFVFVNYSKNDYNGNVTYNLNWESRADDTYERKPYVSIDIEADGDVVYYRKGYTSYQAPSIPKFTDEEAIVKAKEYISIIAPDKVSNINNGKLIENSQYSAEFERAENGIPVRGNSISVEMNPETLELTCYSANWSDVEFPSLDKAISREDAIKAYIEKLGYEVVYNIQTENSKIKRIYTSFVPMAGYAYIDALTGEVSTIAEIVYKSSGALTNDLAMAESASAPRLSPEEIQMLEEIKQMITKEEAEKLARSIPEFDIRKDAEVESFSVSKTRFDEYTAYITFRSQIKDGYYSVTVGINAKTKEIISFGKSQSYDSKSPKYDADKAQEKALEFIEKYYGEKFAKTKPQFTVGNEDNYSFTFDRYENGIRVDGNVLSIRVNEYTGEIDSFSCVWADAEFPTPDIKVTEEEIYNRLLTDDNFRLQYTVISNYIYDSKTGKETRETNVYPLYAVMESPIYSTDELREIDYSGNPVTEKFSGYTDTDGHYCHEAAMALGKIGIYFEGENLMPDKAVTQEEFLNIMFTALYGYRPDNVYKSLIRDGVLAESEVKETITRIEAIRFLLNAMGHKEVAELGGIYNCPFTDVAENMRGYAAIASGFGLVNSNTYTLRADDLMTRAECITILYNYLKR